MSIPYQSAEVTDSSVPLSIWQRDGEDPPGPKAPPLEVALYLMDREACGVFSEVFLLTMWQAKVLCQDGGWDWRKVSPRFRECRALAIGKRLGNGRVSVLPNGIIINESLIDGLQNLNSMPMCPYPLTKCDKWWCPECGPKKVNALIRNFRDAATKQDTVFIASAPKYDKQMCNRVRGQRKEKGAEYLRILRHDDTVFYVASADLGGRKPPCEWTERTVDEAVETLLAEALVIPSHKGHSWSRGWQPPRTEDPSSGLPSQYITVGMDEGPAEAVERELRRRVRARFDVDLDKVPPAARDAVEIMLDEVVQEVRRQGWN
jgi:hypothetical protein